MWLSAEPENTFNTRLDIVTINSYIVHMFNSFRRTHLKYNSHATISKYYFLCHEEISKVYLAK